MRLALSATKGKFLIEAHLQLAESNYSDHDTFVEYETAARALRLYEAGLFRRLQKSKGNKTTP